MANDESGRLDDLKCDHEVDHEVTQPAVIFLWNRRAVCWNQRECGGEGDELHISWGVWCSGIKTPTWLMRRQAEAIWLPPPHKHVCMSYISWVHTIKNSIVVSNSIYNMLIFSHTNWGLLSVSCMFDYDWLLLCCPSWQSEKGALEIYPLCRLWAP